MDPAERKEIVEAFQHEFQTFKEDKIEPLVKSHCDVSNRVIKHEAKIATNTANIVTVTQQAVDNRKHILKIVFFIAGGLISVVIAIMGYMWS